MKKQAKPIVAMIYDFDGTLAPGNIQEMIEGLLIGHEFKHIYASRYTPEHEKQTVELVRRDISKFSY